VAQAEYSEVRKGNVIVGEDGQLYAVVDRDLNTPGNWRAILNLKLKNLKTGAVVQNRFRPDDKCGDRLPRQAPNAICLPGR